MVHLADLATSLAVHRFEGAMPGPRLVVLGAVHGNETCGTRAIERWLPALQSGQVSLRRGALTLVPVANPMAYAQGTREGQRNLNRRLRPSPQPEVFEDHVANVLCPLLAEHDVLLDLHSFHTPGEPFVMVGPDDNAGLLEAFAHAHAEMALARHLGARILVEGWLDTYARGVTERLRRARVTGVSGDEVDPAYGVGTTEYMRSVGGYGVTLECGQHEDPTAPEVASRAIQQTLVLLGMINGELQAPPSDAVFMRLVDVVDRWHEGDTFVQAWRSFDPVACGALIGVRASGDEVRAPDDGWVVFPNPKAGVGHEWFYFAQRSRRPMG